MQTHMRNRKTPQNKQSHPKKKKGSNNNEECTIQKRKFRPMAHSGFTKYPFQTVRFLDDSIWDPRGRRSRSLLGFVDTHAYEHAEGTGRLSFLREKRKEGNHNSPNAYVS